MILIKFIMSAFQKDQKAKTGKTKKQYTSDMLSDLQKIKAKTGVSSAVVAKSTVAMAKG
jgi:hypothetical protein